MERRYRYLGYCHIVALALHRQLRVPLCAFYGYRKDQKERVLVHVGVIIEDSFVDELGPWNCTAEEAGLILKRQNPTYDFFRVYLFPKETSRWRALLRRTNAHKFPPLKYWEIVRFVKKNFLSSR